MNFRIGYEPEDTAELHRLWDDVLTSNEWVGGKYVPEFERLWSEHVGVGAVAFSSWSGAALAMLTYYAVSGRVVLCPSNTFMATPAVTMDAMATVSFLDCSKQDLCVSVTGLRERIRATKAIAVWVVHIGGHIAFDIERIAQVCKEERVLLFEDCAHAAGASFRGKRAGTFGDAGAYSFHATKTISTGEGGMLVSRNKDLLQYAREFRDYGKPTYAVPGLNHRMSEFTAALGVVQTKRLPDIVDWKNEYVAKHLDPIYRTRVRFPHDMVSGYYKFIAFEPVVGRASGKVYEQPCHRILKTGDDLPNTDWIAENHTCPAVWYKGAEL